MSKGQEITAAFLAGYQAALEYHSCGHATEALKEYLKKQLPPDEGVEGTHVYHHCRYPEFEGS